MRKGLRDKKINNMKMRATEHRRLELSPEMRLREQGGDSKGN